MRRARPVLISDLEMKKAACTSHTVGIGVTGKRVRQREPPEDRGGENAEEDDGPARQGFEHQAANGRGEDAEQPPTRRVDRGRSRDDENHKQEDNDERRESEQTLASSDGYSHWTLIITRVDGEASVWLKLTE